MAKSLRSKWKRKMRAEKRVRYGEKEKARLIKMLDQAEKDKAEKAAIENEENMKDGEHEPQKLGEDDTTKRKFYAL